MLIVSQISSMLYRCYRCWRKLLGLFTNKMKIFISIEEYWSLTQQNEVFVLYPFIFLLLTDKFKYVVCSNKSRWKPDSFIYDALNSCSRLKSVCWMNHQLELCLYDRIATCNCYSIFMWTVNTSGNIVYIIMTFV